MCTIIVVHSAALNSSDNLPSYPSDNHHSSDDVYRKGRGHRVLCTYMIFAAVELVSSQMFYG